MKRRLEKAPKFSHIQIKLALISETCFSDISHADCPTGSSRRGRQMMEEDDEEEEEDVEVAYDERALDPHPYVLLKGIFTKYYRKHAKKKKEEA